MPEHRLFAALYDRMLAGAEAAGLAELRGRLLASAHGRTLELGAGTGLNLAHYPAAVNELIATEPDPHMARRLEAKAAEMTGTGPASIHVVQTGAEELPFEDESFDTVVATLVLCTAEDPVRALAEARRVLVPGGQLLFTEHVRSERPRLARWQDALERPWGMIAGGCHPNRQTGELIASSGFWVDRMDRGRLPGALRLVRPMITGVARRPAPIDRDTEEWVG